MKYVLMYSFTLRGGQTLVPRIPFSKNRTIHDIMSQYRNDVELITPRCFTLITKIVNRSALPASTNLEEKASNRKIYTCGYANLEIMIIRRTIPVVR